MPDVVTLGECMAVLYPPEPVTLDDTKSLLLDIGGAEANLSIALCRLGRSARFISRVGDDPSGANGTPSSSSARWCSSISRTRTLSLLVVASSQPRGLTTRASSRTPASISGR